MISIIIPVYNVEQYLHQCIESVLSQSISDFELLLVDDGSTDASGAICDDYASMDNRIRAIHIPNSGVSVARNTGIEASKGEWITFIDSDDFIESNYLANFQIAKKDADLIIQGLEYYDNRNGRYFKQVFVSNSVLGELGFKETVAQNDLLRSGYPVAKAYKRELLSDNIRFNTNISFHEDHIFVLEAMNVAKTIRLVNSVAYKYRYYHSETSLSQKNHSWEKLNVAAEGMLTCLEVMKDRFLEEGSSYSRSIYTFAYEPKLAAVNELFRSDDTYKNIKHNYYTIINNIELRKMYHPTDRRSRLFKSVMLHLPFCGIYLFFKALVKYQNRNR